MCLTKYLKWCLHCLWRGEGCKEEVQVIQFYSRNNSALGIRDQDLDTRKNFEALSELDFKVQTTTAEKILSGLFFSHLDQGLQFSHTFPGSISPFIDCKDQV